MQLPKKKYVKVITTAEFIDIQMTNNPKQWLNVLDSDGMKELANALEESLIIEKDDWDNIDFMIDSNKFAKIIKFLRG